MIGLDLPYYRVGRVFKQFLLFSWAGQPLSGSIINEVDRGLAIDAITRAYTEIHRQKIWHGDPYPRNILYDAASKHIMIANFELALFGGDLAFDPNTTFGQVLVKHLEEQRNHFDESELQTAVANLSELLGDEQVN
jgi:tRNA A-37 threonylcarbamoyl transferase component Bud32